MSDTPTMNQWRNGFNQAAAELKRVTNAMTYDHTKHHIEDLKIVTDRLIKYSNAINSTWVEDSTDFTDMTSINLTTIAEDRG